MKKQIDYILKDAVLEHCEDPRHFPIPSEEDIRRIRIGDDIKLIFALSEPTEDGCRAERMWVRVLSMDGSHFVGELENEPYFITTIRAGDMVTFCDRNIASINEAPGIAFQKLALISRRAYDNREINWIVRDDELCDEDDSGWQLLYGDEDDAYLENYAETALLISLEQALQIEPLLEKPFSEKGHSYEYQEEANSFVLVDE